MTVSRLLGIVPVKMFDSGQTFDLSLYGTLTDGFKFDPQSDVPMLSNRAFLQRQGVISSIASEVPGVFGLSSLESNPTPATGTGAGILSNIGGVARFFNNDPLDDKSVLLYSKPQPRAAGSYVGKPFSWFNFEAGGAVSFFLNPAAMNNNFHPAIGTLLNPTGVEVDMLVQFFEDEVFTSPGLLKTGAFATFVAGSSLLLSRLNGNPFYDNSLFASATLNHTTNILILFNSIVKEDATYLQQQLNLVTMDNPVLDAPFQNVGNPFIQTYRNGFIFPLATGGAGPTHQNHEIAVFNQDMTGYYLLDFAAMDAEADLQLNHGGGAPQVKIDPDGVIWFNSGDPTQQNKVLFSFSSGFNFPVYYLGSLQPITLPCFVDTMA